MKKNVIKLLVLAVAMMSVLLAFASCGCSHEEEIIPAKEATCTEKGLTEGKKCKLCGEITLEQNEIDMISHSPKNAQKVEPTCTEDGHEAGVECEVCHTAITGMAKIPAAHKPVDIDAKAATCEAEGVEAGKRCSVCNEDLEGFAPIAKLPHNLVDVAKIEPGCVTAGSEAGKKCSECDYFEGLEAIAPLNHIEKTVAKVEPTCATDGAEAGVVCERCNETVSGCQLIPKLGHDIKNDTIVITTQPTLGVAGVGTATCNRCNDTKVEVEIPAIPGRVWNYDCENVDDIGVKMELGGVDVKLEKADGRSYVTYSYTGPSSGEWMLFFTPEMKLGELDADTKFIFKTDMKFGSIVPTANYATNGNPWFMYTGINDTDTRGDNDHLITFWKYWNVDGSHVITPHAKDGGNVAPYNEWFTLTVVTYLSTEVDEKTQAPLVYVDYYVGETFIGTVKISTLNNSGAEKINDPVSSFELKFKNKSNYESFSLSLDNTSFYTEDYTPEPPAEDPVTPPVQDSEDAA